MTQATWPPYCMCWKEKLERKRRSGDINVSCFIAE